jgi:ribonucleoside-diphosphate reductase alpha chain
MSTQNAVDYSSYQTIRRNGSVVAFEPSKISTAMMKAFLSVVHANEGSSSSLHAKVQTLTEAVVKSLLRSRGAGGAINIEDIQDQVELALMRAGEQEVARSYVLYREKRKEARAAQQAATGTSQVIHVTRADGRSEILDILALRARFESAAEGLPLVQIDPLMTETLKNVYDNIREHEVNMSAIMAARGMIEREPQYNQLTARLLLDDVRLEVLGETVSHAEMKTRYATYFPEFIQKGIAAELLSEKLAEFDLARLGAALEASRDYQFGYLGLQTLYDRYFLHVEDTRIELPQAFFMRVAMGLALNESDREGRAIEFYNLLSSFDFMSSTPTLFNSGSLRSQLSSCYLTTVDDDLDGIYEALKENALLSKFAGGLGNDWTRVRSLGSRIKGTNGQSQGVVPFLKVVNDTAVAVNQGGKRKGAVCAYLETWHGDIEEFLELRKNTGDDRRRTHDMNTANWIPDLFMKRVMEGADWSLLSPSEAPDLHDLYGRAFEERYKHYEALGESGKLKVYKKVPALTLWRKMLQMLFETGHPWITFKDPSNIRSPQQHVGVVHSSNLCTEITLNTNDQEIAVCNLGSVNLVAHLKESADGKLVLDHDKLQRTIRVAMRMLDNVIDINFYAVDKARASNMRHRPVGMGLMGFQDALHAMKVPYASQAAVEFADESMEVIAYYAYLASTELAEERGAYESFKGSLWDRGILPQDSQQLLAEERGGYLEVNTVSRMPWSNVRERIAQFGMRNSNCLAIAPTATISNIIGVSACIEPTFQNLFVKSNLSGEFTVVNDYLVRDLKALGLWDSVMAADLKYFDGSLAQIGRIPQELKDLYATAFEVDPAWLVEAAARRQKWIDQAQSLNIYMAGASGKKLDEVYKLAWLRGLKTTYYLRTKAASAVEKSTVSRSTHNAVSAHGDVKAAPAVAAEPQPIHDAYAAMPVVAEEAEGPACFLRPGDQGFDECEACQ